MVIASIHMCCQDYKSLIIDSWIHACIGALIFWSLIFHLVHLVFIRHYRPFTLDSSIKNGPFDQLKSFGLGMFWTIHEIHVLFKIKSYSFKLLLQVIMYIFIKSILHQKAYSLQLTLVNYWLFGQTSWPKLTIHSIGPYDIDHLHLILIMPWIFLTIDI